MRTNLSEKIKKCRRETGDYTIPHPFIKNYFFRVSVKTVPSDVIGVDPFERVSVDIWERTNKTRDEYRQVDRCVNYNELLFIKDSFFSPEEVVIQYFPPMVDFVHFKNQLILWRYTGQDEQQLPSEITRVLESKDLADAVKMLQAEFPGIENDSEFYDAIYHANKPLGSEEFKDEVRKQLLNKK